MHMSDALLSPAVAGTMYAASGLVTAYSVKKVKRMEDGEMIPVMGVMGAFVFASQMVNFSLPGTGSSGHLCGSMLLSAILGPEAALISMIGVLLIQCLLFADGGLLALGANIWNMAFYGCFVGGGIIWRYFMRNGMTKKKITAASMLGAVLALQLGAFSVVLETTASGVTELPFGVFAAVMQPIHLAIGLVEGLITAAILVFLFEARPELLWGYQETEKENDFAKGWSLKGVLALLAVCTVLIGGGLSLFASAFPDGLEWSLGKVAGEETIGKTSGWHTAVQGIQDATAKLADYNFANSSGDAGTAFSGIVGGALVLVLLVGGCLVYKRLFRGRTREKSEDQQ